jgi:hypothetical protein
MLIVVHTCKASADLAQALNAFRAERRRKRESPDEDISERN